MCTEKRKKQLKNWLIPKGTSRYAVYFIDKVDNAPLTVLYFCQVKKTQGESHDQ